MSEKNPFKAIRKDVERFIRDDLPRIAGKMAVDEFRENFRRQGFRNNGIQQWEEVKRRDPSSPWYGFQYKGERRDYVKLKRDKKSGKLMRAVKQKKLNYSPAATQRRILIGPGANLMNSISVRESGPKRVIIGTDAPQAQVQNEGGIIRIFGKAKVRLPKRQFIGESKELMEELQEKFLGKIDSIIDKHV